MMASPFLKMFGALILACGTMAASAQVQGLDEGSPDHQTAERLMIRSGSHGLLAPGLKPYNRETLTAFALSIDDSSLKLTDGDKADLRRLFPAPHDLMVYGHSSEPRYFGESAPAWRVAQFVDRLTPPRLAATLMVFVRKAG